MNEREALRLIADTDPVDAALDPQRLREIAADALAAQPAAEPVAADTVKLLGDVEDWLNDLRQANHEGYVPQNVFSEAGDLVGRIEALRAAQPARAGGDAPEAPDMVPPASSRDRWMYRQGWLAALDPRSHPNGLPPTLAALAAAPQPAAAEPDALQTDVLNLLAMLEEGEYAERWAKSELGKRLEDAVTELHNDIHEAADEVEQPAASTVPATVTDEVLWRAAHDGFDNYWTEDSKGINSEAWLASAKKVLAVAAPAAVERQPLTDEQIEALAKPFIRNCGDHWHKCAAIEDNGNVEDFARAIERAHGIGSSKEGGGGA